MLIRPFLIAKATAAQEATALEVAQCYNARIINYSCRCQSTAALRGKNLSITAVGTPKRSILGQYDVSDVAIRSV